MILLSDLQYFSSIIWYKISIEYSHVEFDQYESWQKMSFRNRCQIVGGNGVITLSVPVSGGRNVDGLVRDIKIDNSQGWQRIHWRSILSAYNRSPWFEFYRTELEKIYNTKQIFLWDWNLQLNLWTFEKLGWQPQISFSETYINADDILEKTDIRGLVSPKNLSQLNAPGPVYTQVFEDRLGFIPNMSILDLLFSEGKNALHLLKKGAPLSLPFINK